MEILKINFKIIKSQKLRFILNFFIWFLIHSIPLLIALFIKNLIYNIEIKNISNYKIICIFIISIAFLQIYLIIKGGEIDTKFRFKIRQLIRKKILLRAIDKNKINEKDKSEILEIITTDVYSTEELISTYIDLLCKLIFIIFSSISLSIINFKIIIILVIPMTIINYIVLKLKNIIGEKHYIARNEKINYINFINQLLNTREQISSFNIEKNIDNIFKRVLYSVKIEDLKNNIINYILLEIPSFLNSVNTVLIMLFFIVEFNKNNLDIGDFYLLVTLSSYIAMYTSLFTEILSGTKYFENFLTRIKNIFNINYVEILDKINYCKYRKIEFKQENNLNVKNVKIKDQLISFSLKDKEILVITGNVGSGKTMLIDKILLNNSSENIVYNEEFLKDININDIFSYSNQQINFLNESVVENITLLNEDIDYIKCLKMVNLYEELSKQGKIEEYKIGENGSKLSEGQKQRLAIARAIGNYRKILILDDSFSLIDDKNKISIVKNLKKLEFTAIIISNDLNIINLADKVLKI